MHHPRPRRLQGFTYLGYHRYHVTICACGPGLPLSSPAIVLHVLEQLRQHVEEEEFALLAYCFMPDHVHFVLEGLSEAADLRRLVGRWKQATGYWYARQCGRRLWMPGFADRVLRDGSSVMRAVKYVLSDPVRRGLAGTMFEFAFAGSDVFESQELREILDLEQA